MKKTADPNLLLPGLLLVLIGILAPYHIISHDIWFELAGGRHFLAHPGFPFVDVFSYVTAGQPFVNQEWLSEVLFYVIYRAGGVSGLVVFKVIVIAASFLLLFQWLKKRGADPWVVFWVLFLTLLLSRYRFNVRPHLFSDFLFMVIFMMLLDKHRRGSDKIIYLAPVLMLVWTNLHFGSLFGFLLMAGFLAGYLIIFISPPLLRAETESRAKDRFFHLAAAFFLSLGASLINPAGKGLFDIFEPIMKISYKLQVLEMLPTLAFPAALYFPLYWTLLVIYPLILLFNARRVDLFDLMFFLTGLALSQYMMRFVPLFGLLSAPLMCTVLTRALREEGRVAKFTSVFRHPATAIVLSLVTAFGIVNSRQGLLGQFHYGFGVDAKHPFEAIRFMEDNRIDGNVFNDIKYGGQILFKRFPHNKIFLYGRYSLADEATADAYLALLKGDAFWRDWFARHDVNIIFLGRELAESSPLSLELAKDPAWVLVYADQKAVVLVRDVPAFQDVIARFRHGFDVAD